MILVEVATGIAWSQIFTNVVSIVAAIAALSVSIWVFLKTPLGWALRWVWTKSVADPIAKWNTRTIGEVVHEKIEHLMHHRNNGSSLLDLAEAVAEVKEHVSTLLRHDQERDVTGRRYGGAPKNEGEADE